MKRPAKRSLANRRCGWDGGGTVEGNRRCRRSASPLEHSVNGDWNAAAVPGADRGSRAERSCEGRLRHLPTRRAAHAGSLLKLGLSPQAKMLDLRARVRCRGCGARGRAVVSVRWQRNRQGQVIKPLLPAPAIPGRGKGGHSFLPVNFLFFKGGSACHRYWR